MKKQPTTKDGFSRGRHVIHALHAHLVFVSKYRRGVFTSGMLTDMEGVMSMVCSDMGATLVEFNGEANHVHLLVHYPPTLAISRLVNALKGVSSRYLRKHHRPALKGKLYGDHLWSPSYFAGSVGEASLEAVKHYIQQQERPLSSPA